MLFYLFAIWAIFCTRFCCTLSCIWLRCLICSFISTILLTSCHNFLLCSIYCYTNILSNDKIYIHSKQFYITNKFLIHKYIVIKKVANNCYLFLHFIWMHKWQYYFLTINDTVIKTGSLKFLCWFITISNFLILSTV